MAIATGARKAAGIDPATGRPRTLVGSLRNVAACALGGAVVSRVFLGHDIGGQDPSAYGAVFGALLGLTAWAAGRL